MSSSFKIFEDDSSSIISTPSRNNNRNLIDYCYGKENVCPTTGQKSLRVVNSPQNQKLTEYTRVHGFLNPNVGGILTPSRTLNTPNRELKGKNLAEEFSPMNTSITMNTPSTNRYNPEASPLIKRRML